MAHEIQPQKDERSVGELFSTLSHETTTLVKQEVALAKTEMIQKAAAVGKDIGFLVAGCAVAYAGVLALITTIILALSQAGVTWWLAALAVGLVVAGTGGFLVWKGMTNFKQESVAPQETVATLKEDAAWAKEQTK